MTTRFNSAFRALLPFLSAVPVSTWAHEFMTQYVTHEVRVTVGPKNIDITVDLTFNELVSLQERRKMDHNQDGRIEADEGSDYLAALASKLARGVHLTVGGQAADIFTLYDPQLDCLGEDRVVPAHHVLRLAYFARTPSHFSAATELVLQDDLWAEAPALSSFQAIGADGIRVSLDSNHEILSQSRTDAGKRNAVIKIHDVQ